MHTTQLMPLDLSQFSGGELFLEAQKMASMLVWAPIEEPFSYFESKNGAVETVVLRSIERLEASEPRGQNDFELTVVSGSEAVGRSSWRLLIEPRAGARAESEIRLRAVGFEKKEGYSIERAFSFALPVRLKKEKTPPKRIFISYAQTENDRRWWQEFERFLIEMKQEGDLQTAFFSDAANLGDDVEERMSYELEQSEVILLLISVDFLIDERCRKELARSLERREKGLSQVFPILIRSCSWENDFEGLELLPADGRPLSTRIPTGGDAFSQKSALENAVFEVIKSIREKIRA